MSQVGGNTKKMQNIEMNRLFSFAALWLSMSLYALTPTQTVRLYPDGAPDSNGYTASDEHVENETMIFQIAEPRLDIYQPDSTPRGIILSIPGGAYLFVSSGNEGINVADFFVPRGYIVAVLKYRLPNRYEHIPLRDALQAMRILRDSAAVWQAPEAPIGVMGFSAGGHLAASLLTHYTDAVTRPDYGVLVYPVISMDSTLTHHDSCHRLLGEHPSDDQRNYWSCEKQVTSDTPLCLIVGCQDDPIVPIANSIRFYEALTAHNVPSSLLIVPYGQHGWGFSIPFPYREHIDQAILSFIAAHSISRNP